MSPEEIRAHRKRLGLNQVDLAVLVGAKRTAVGNWESGLRRPRRQYVRALGAVFGLRTPDGLCPMRPAGCGCRCHGRRPRSEMAVLNRRRRT